MAGVKQFNQEEVLNKAMQVFWRQGYEGTSIQDLTKATGLGRGSLYGAFGDKEGLFLAVLDHYADQIQAQIAQSLKNDDPREGITNLFQAIVERMVEGNCPPGCLNTNTVLESPAGSERIQRKIAERLGKMESDIYELLLKAQTERSLPLGTDIRALSRFFLAVTQGMTVLNKAFADPSVVKDVAKVAISFWHKYQDSSVK